MLIGLGDTGNVYGILMRKYLGKNHLEDQEDRRMIFKANLRK
jgi:hypothetical protein